jgi:hypothetical protein
MVTSLTLMRKGHSIQKLFCHFLPTKKEEEMLFGKMFLFALVLGVHNNSQATCTKVCTDCAPPDNNQSQLPLPLDIIPGKEPLRHPRQKPPERSPNAKNKPQQNPSQRKKQNKNIFPTKNLHNKFPHQKNYRPH